MTDRPPASSPDALRRMRNQRQSDTRCEVALRKTLWRQGFRYRVDYRLPLKGLRRKADIAFPAKRIAVFVDGCFWHSCPEHATRPANNAEWWSEKLAANVRRDRDTDQRLRDVGWTVVRIWEHEAPDDAATKVAHAVRRGGFAYAPREIP